MASPVVFLSGSDYGSGDWADKSGNGNSASLATGVAEVNTDGNGIVLNGNTKWTLPNLGIGNSWTLEAWYKDNGTTQGQASIIARNDPGNTSPGPILGFMQNGSIEGAFYVSNENWYQGTLVPLQNTMTHYAVTWDGTTMITYVNNVEIGSVTLTGVSANNGQQFFIGSDWTGGYFMTGELGEIRIYNVALTAAQISADYQESAPTFGILPSNPLTPYNLTKSAVTTTAFVVSWLGGADATSYTFTLNGSAVEPLVDGNSATFTGLTSNTDYAVIVTANTESDSQASQPKSIKTLQEVPTALNVSTSLIKSNSFVASWTGGEGASSYTYSLNGSAATPSVDNALTSQTVKFTGLTPTTEYTLVVTAVNGAGEVVSSVTITTLNPPPVTQPVNQLVLSDSADDLGTSVFEVGIGNVIEYTNYYGKDCVYINSDGTNPKINTPCVFTEASPFTFGFWINFDNVASWCVPITMTGPNIDVTLGFDAGSMYLSLGNGQGGLYTQSNFLTDSNFRTWNHITVTYSSGTFTIYKNGVEGGSLSIQSGFTTSQITIGGNTQYQYGLGGQVPWAGYLHQLCVFDSALSNSYISQLVTQTQGNKVFILPTNLLTPYELELSNLTYTGFKISWLGGLDATYTFTLNGESATPLVEGNSATFSGLTPDTLYILLITAISTSDSQTSTPKTVRTRKPLTNPIHQYVFNGLTDDVGTTPSAMIVEDPDSIIEYVTYAGRNCIHINSDGDKPNLKIPYVVSNTSSFTLSYWANITTDYRWQIPLILKDGQKSIIFSALITDNVYVGAGTTTASSGSSPDQSGWNHIVMTYSNGIYKVYVNSYVKFIIPYTETFTSTEVSICGNSKYLVSIFGPTVCNSYIRQLCIFDSLLNADQVNQLYTRTQDNTAFAAQTNTEAPYFLIARNVGYSSFTATWLGGSGSYTYTLNGSPVIPSTDNGATKTATFTGLNNGTSYTLVVTGGELSSSPVTIKTKAPLPSPVNQFIFNNSSEDVGTNPVTAVGQGTYTNYSGKDCLDINTDGTNQLMTIPYVITNTSPFTLSFWLHLPYTWYNWNIPVGVDDGSSSILEFAGIWDATFYIPFGNQNGHTDTYLARTDWTHVVLSYDNGYYNVYLNDKLAWSSTVNITFTSTRINIGGNNPFVGWYLGQYLTSAVAKIRQLCTFNVALNDEQVSQLYIQSQENSSVGAPPNPLKPSNLIVSSLTKTSFVVSWSGAEGATSYTYTVNGSPVIPTEGTKSATFTSLIADTNYSVVVTAVNDTESQASQPKNLRTLPNPPLKPIVSVTSQTYNSFSVVWTYGDGATSYTYTLNGSPATPSTDGSLTSQTLEFTGLSPSTAYTLVITAINAGGQTIADPVTATTAELPPFPVAIHQLILDNSTNNVGSSGATTSSIGDIVFTNYEGKDCINCTYSGPNNPSIVLPCAFTNESSFTISFWEFAYSSPDWRTSITLNDGTQSQIIFGALDSTNYIVVGIPGSYSDNTTTEHMNANAWNNLTLTYENSLYKLYVNGINTGLEFNLNTTWESSQITIGFNNNYRSWFFGGQGNDTMHIRQLCVFNSVLTPEDISTLYTLTDGNTVLGVPPNPLRPSSLIVSSLSTTSFVVSWSGASGATSYTFTLNGTAATPTQVNKTATFTDLTPNTDYTVIVTAVNDTESQASTPKNLKTLMLPPTALSVSINSVTYNSFVGSWTGAEGAESYVYTLNETETTPFTQTSNSVTFKSLIPMTAYTLVVKAINAGGEAVSEPSTVTTLEAPPLPYPNNQLVLNDSTDDLGAEPAEIVTTGDIIYTNMGGKDCIVVSVFNETAEVITVPCFLSSESSFTISFWYLDNTSPWSVPITLNNGTHSRIIFGIGNASFNILLGDQNINTSGFGAGPSYNGNPSNIVPGAWNHFTLTLEGNIYKMYVNGIDTASLEYTFAWESSQVTIGYNINYSSWWTGQVNESMYIRQVCVFDSALIAEQVSNLYTETQENTIIAPPASQLTPYRIVSSIATSSFNVSWLGGVDALSYSFTLNGSPATPSSETMNSATFTGLTPGTSYILVITAIGASESRASNPKNLKTFSIPTNQLILSDSSEDLGTSTVAAESGDLIEYTNYAGKDCVFIISDGVNPTIKVPCVFTQASSFTFAFWINFDNVGGWCVPITMNGTNINITLGFDPSSMHLSLGGGLSNHYTQIHIMHGSDFRTWNHITVTYSSETVYIYKNGSLASSLTLEQAFTTSQITIGGNVQYQYNLGGQVQWSGYLRQLCVFDSLLSAQEISQLYTQTATNTVIVSIPNQLKPYSVDLVNVEYTEFTISWSGGLGATSYTFTLNGAPVTPSIQENSASFTGLTPNTSYTVIVTAISASDTQSSFSKTVKTRSPISNPRHQFVFNGTNVDVGTNHSYTVVRDPDSIIEYLTYEGKDCVHINSDGDKPNIKIPYVVSNTSSFTVSYWANMIDNGSWQIPVAVGDGKNSILFTGITGQEIYIGSGFTNVYGGGTQLNAGWNHIVTTYSNRNIRVYVNGVIKFTTSLNISFTSTEISVCGNNKYGVSNFGQTSANAYIRQICVFDSALNSDHVSQLYLATQGNSSFIQPTAPIYGITVKNVEYTSFDLSWLGESATYTLNGSSITPSTETVVSASFTGLSPDTQYSLVVTSGQYSSTIIISTKRYLSAPVNQFILNNSIQDVGTEPIASITAQGETYVTYDGKDCVSINTNGISPAITIPYVITDTNPFTVSFWLNVPYLGYWTVPIGIDDTTRSIIGYITVHGDSYISLGDKTYNVSGYYRSSTNWNHVVITYNNGNYSIYANNKIIYNSIFGNIFTSTRINIGGNAILNAWGVGEGNTLANIRQICTFDYPLNDDEVNELYITTQGVQPLALPSVPLFPYRISFTDVTFTGFTVSWLGGVDAMFYTFTINGDLAFPSSQTTESASFTGLIPGTTYTVVVTAMSESDSKASRPKRVVTRTPLPLPINEFIFINNEDVGVQPVVSTVTDPDSVISYTNYAGKDSVYFITSDGILPTMNIPCVFTEASSFTFGFWINFENVGGWCVPITMNGPNINITCAFSPTEMYLQVGGGQANSYNSIYTGGFNFTTWAHIAIKYNNGNIRSYINGTYAGFMSFPNTFTTSQITIGGNVQYQYNLGGQVPWSGYLHQLCVFDSALDQYQANELYTKTADNTVIAIPVNPLTPYRLRVSELTTTSFTLSWLGGTDATSYTFTLNGSPFTPSTDITAKTAVFTGLTISTSYTLVVTGVNDTEQSSSYPIVVKTLSQPPTALSVTVGSITTSSFDVSWTGGEGATTYTYTLNDLPVTPSSQTPQSATFASLSSTTSYTLVVTAVNSSGETSSEPVTVTTSSAAPLAPIVSTSSVTYQSFVASWTGEGATSYSYTLNNTSVTPVEEGSSATFDLLDADTSYILVVKAINASGETSSMPVLVRTLRLPPTTVSLTTSSITYESFIVSWTGGEGALDYTFTLNGAPFTPVLEGSSATFTGLSPATSYTVVVTAINNGGETSSETLISTFSLPPTALSVTLGSITFNSFVASWTGGEGAVEYNYMLNGSPVTPEETSNSATFIGLSGATGYTLVITAVNDGGQTPSEPVSTTTLPNPPATLAVSISSVTYQSFVASWIGGEGATSYSYTLNGSSVTPIDDGLMGETATFTDLTGATEYTLVVTAINEGGQSSSTPLVITTLPNPPAALVVSTSEITYESFVASWTGGEGAASYSYTLNSSPVTPSSQTSSSATFSGLSGATEYTLVITAINEGGQTSSAPSILTTLVNPPTAISVTTSAITYNSFVASWVGGEGATLYTYKLNGSTVEPSVTDGSATFTGLSAATEYSLVVSAINAGGKSVSEPVIVTTIVAPPAAMIVATSTITYQSFVASWTGGEGATSYTYTLNNSSVTPSTDNSLTNKEVIFTDLDSATNYTLVVTAINDGGQSVADSVTVRTLSAPPASLTVSINSMTYQSFVASWVGGEGATSYTYTLNDSPVTPSSQTANSATFASLNPETSYTIIVTAITEGGETSSEPVTETTFSTPPTAPNATSSAITYESFVASWTGGVRVTSYIYTLNGSVVTPSESENSATFTALSANTSYTLVITAVNNGGQADSPPLTLTTLRTPPTRLSITTNTITYSSFVASWTGGSGATSYSYTLNGSAVTPIDNGVESKTATFTGLDGSTSYTLVVTAINNGGEMISDPVLLTTLDTPAMALSVSISDITYESFVASWTGGNGATEYRYTLNGSSVTPEDNGLTSKSATFTSLSAATSYTLIVSAVNNSGQTDSPPVVVTTFRTPPTALNITASSITYQSFVASWTGGVGATSYTYTLDGSSVTPSSQTANSAQFASLSPVTSYTLVVTAINNGGQATSEILVTTVETPPTAPNVSVSSITYQSFVASWPVGTGATEYRYTLNGSPVSPSESANSATFTSLSALTSYTLVVTAINSGGQASSTPVTTTTFNTPPTIASLSTSSITSQSFVASWTAARATSYGYTLNGSAATPYSQTSNSATFVSLSSATSYTLIVTAINNGGEATSDSTTITTLNQIPSIISVTLGSVTYNSFVASWTGGSPASSYVYTLNGSTLTPSVDNGLTGKTATFTSLNSATGYTLIVKAVNNGGDRSSEPVIITTLSTPPTALTVSTGSVTYSSFTASWTGGVGATSYNYILNGYSVTPSSQNMNSAQFTSLNPNTNYTLIVTAINNGGEAVSPAVMETTLRAPPMAMSVTVASITYQSFIASWTGGTGATSYSYTLNGSSVTPEDNGLTSKSATFTGLSGATGYTLIVTAIDEGGQTSSDPLTVTTLPNPPTALSVSTSSITDQSFVASWTGGVGSISYQYTLNGSSVTPSIDNGLTSKTVAFTSLSANTSYTLVVTAVNTGGQTAASPVVITTLVTPPTIPIVSAGSITYNSFVASWTGGSGATSYTYTLNGSTATPLTQTASSATFASLSSATSYTFIVTAVNNGGQTSSSPLVVTTFTQPPTALSVSTGSITYNSFVASWTGGSGATSYGYMLNGSATTPSSQTSNSATFTSLSGFTSYTLVVTAVNNGGQISSDPATITTLIAPPTTLSVTVAPITYQSFVASWTGGSGANSYSYTLNGSDVTPSSQTSNSATFTDLSGATSYTLVVTAVNGGGQTVSTPIVVRTPIKPPTALSVTAGSITYNSFVASWTGGEGATSYTYTLNSSATTASSQTSSSATFSPLTPSTNYTVIVTAVNGGGQSVSTAILVKTLAQQVYPIPIHQFVLSDTLDDSGSVYIDLDKTDPQNKITYANNDGKDCIHIVSDGYIPKLNMPCVFTEASSFTLGFWIKFDSIAAWGVPISMNGTNININIGFNEDSLYISAGNGVNTSYAQNNIMIGSDFKQWNNISITYKDGSIKIYKNGAYGGYLNFTQAFTISQITIGGNYTYQSIGLGGRATWDGYLRQVCVFDSVINGNDILQLYTNTADNTVLGTPLPQVANLKNTFINTTNVQSATAAIDAALASNMSPVNIVTAALSTVLPTMFTALVNNPAFIGTTVSIPPSVASTLYAGFEDKSTLNTSLTFNINFPAADNTVTPPTSTSNSKLAIDLSLNTYVSFRGCTGYGIHVISGDQYFTTPENPIGTLVRVGDILTFTTNLGTTGSFKVADLDIVLIPYTPPTVVCFLGSAPVLTPNGYCRIDSLKVGDLVSTREGDTSATIERVERKQYMPSCDTNPYIIPAGRFGSNGRILISPRHKVAVDGEMIEARFLGLEQEEQYEKITYYNIQVTNCENIVVAGLEVESLQVLARVNIPIDAFNYIVKNKYYGKISDEMKERCHLMADGSMSVPIMI